MIKPLHAELSLESRLAGRAGSDRIALLEAIRDTGSISGAAKQVGLSYRAAWDAVQVLNNLFTQTLVTALPGGARGGGAALTRQGHQVIASFRVMEQGLRRMLDGLQGEMAGAAGMPASSLMWALSMKISTRNALRGVVDRVIDGAVNAEVILKIGAAAEIVSVVTRQSVEDLDLRPGREAVALINASSIILARGDETFRTSARNKLSGTIVQHHEGAVNDEISLEIDEGKTLTATVTSESAKLLDLRTGERAFALIKASHVILAVD